MYFNGGMPNPYDVALRERAVRAYERGEGSYKALAALFKVDHRTLERWVARWRLKVLPIGRGVASLSGIGFLAGVVIGQRVYSDMDPLRELCRTYNRRVPRAQRTTRASFHRAFRRAGFVVKKNVRARAKSTARMWRPRGRPL